LRLGSRPGLVTQNTDRRTESTPLGSHAGSTEKLLVRVQGGSQSALDELFDRLRRSLRRWSSHLLPPSARRFRDTSDIVQDVISRALPRLRGFEPRHRDALRHYLRTAVRNRVRDEIRYVSRRPAEALGDGEPRAQDDPLRDMLTAERDTRLARAVSLLEDREQELLVARFDLQLSFEQIALAAGYRSADAARMAVNRALVRLGRAMERV